MDEDSIKLRLDSHELVLNKGKSKSGRFLPLDEIKSLPMEAWSYTILNQFFNTSCGQLSIFSSDEI